VNKNHTEGSGKATPPVCRYTDAVKILTNFKNLKVLLIYIDQPSYTGLSAKAELKKGMQYLEMNGIMKNYEVKYFEKYCLFLKREFNDSGVENSVLGSLRKSSFYSGLIRSLYLNNQLHSL
jgi:hypothetical protein